MRARDALLATLILAGLRAAGCGGSTEEGKAGPPGQAGRGPGAGSPPARLEPARPAAAAEKSEPDTILSVLSVEHEVDLRAQRDGSVVELQHDEGDRVPTGGMLARLDDRELLTKIDRTRADLQVGEMNVKYNEAEVKARQAAYRRAQEMHKLGLNSDADLEEAEFKAIGSQYDLESWRAVVERTRADIRTLEVELDKTRILSPFPGIVARRYIRLGQNVVKDEKCFRLTQLTPLLVRFLVPETAARPPRPGETLQVSLVADSQRLYPARIRKVSPVVDAASGSYEVQAELFGSELGELRPGMSVRVRWPGASGLRPPKGQLSPER